MPLSDRNQHESLWAGLFHDWFLHYFLPGLVSLGVALYGLYCYWEKRDREQKVLLEETRQAVREGKAGEAFNRLFPDEHQEHLRNKDKKSE
jgi:hypothetical protein